MHLYPADRLTSIQDEIQCAMLMAFKEDRFKHKWFYMVALMLDKDEKFLHHFETTISFGETKGLDDIENVMNYVVTPRSRGFCKYIKDSGFDCEPVASCKCLTLFSDSKEDLDCQIENLSKELSEKYGSLDNDKEENLEIVLTPIPGEEDRWSISNRRMGKCPFDDALFKFIFFYNRHILPSYPEDEMWKKTPWGQKESGK